MDISEKKFVARHADAYECVAHAEARGTRQVPHVVGIGAKSFSREWPDAGGNEDWAAISLKKRRTKSI